MAAEAARDPRPIAIELKVALWVVSDSERDAGWKRIKTAAKKFDAEVTESSWREIGKD